MEWCFLKIGGSSQEGQGIVAHSMHVSKNWSFAECGQMVTARSLSSPSHSDTTTISTLWWSERKRLPKGVALLGGVVCWRMSDTVKVGFEVSKMLKPRPVRKIFPMSQGVGLPAGSMSACMLPCHPMIIVDQTSENVSHAVQCFPLLELPCSWSLFTAAETLTRTCPKLLTRENWETIGSFQT